MEVFKSVFSSLVSESDRGAVLVAAEIINNQLDKLFRETSQKSVTKTLLDRLLEYPGPLSTLSAKNDVAYSVGLIRENVHSSINILRHLRNNAAHSQSDFTLESHKDKLTELIKLGPNMVPSIISFASELLIRNAIENVLENRENLDDDLKELYPSTHEEAFDHIKDEPKIIDVLEERHPRMTLGVAVSLLSAIITAHKVKHTT